MADMTYSQMLNEAARTKRLNDQREYGLTVRDVGGFEQGKAVNAANAAAGAAVAPGLRAQADQSRAGQDLAAQYYNNLVSGRAPSLSDLQRRQGQDTAMAAIQSAAMSNQGNLAGGLTQRNLLNAQAAAQQGIAGQAQQNAIAEQQGALGLASQQANAQRAADLQQQAMMQNAYLQGGALQASTYGQGAGRIAQAAMQNAQTNLAARGQDIQGNLGQRQLNIAEWQGEQQAALQRAQFEEENSWWNKYGVPILGGAATLGAAALSGGTSMIPPAAAAAAAGARR